GVKIDGAAVDGPLVKVLTDGQSPVTVTNEGQDTTITISTYGVPAEPEPAGGNGYAIGRSYYTLTGEPASLDGGRVGDRLVAVVEVTPFGYSDGRLIVADPLPAGFEIDNPNLMSAGSVANLDWLDALTDVTHSEFRQDRFITAVDWSSRNSFRLAYV